MDEINKSNRFTLTHGALLSSINNGIDRTIKPVVQIILCHPIDKPEIEESRGRYKLMISDGTHYMPCVTHQRMCIYFINGTLKKNAVIELEEYTVQQLNDAERTYCLGLIEATALEHGYTQIGEPKNIMRELSVKVSVTASLKTDVNVNV